MQLTLQKIADALGVPCPVEVQHTAVQAVVSDSRQVSQGALFACVPGERCDGHDYAQAACEQGACAILAEHPLEGLQERFPDVAVFITDNSIRALGRIAAAWRDMYKGTVIGLTGTAGKTTTKEWLAAVLGSTGAVAKTEGNHNNQLGLPLSMLAAKGDERFWIFECGVSHPQDMDELGAILRPDIAIVLNVGEGHTEGLGDKGVAWYKTQLFKYLSEGGTAVASADYADLVSKAMDACPKTLFFTAKSSSYADEARIASRVRHIQDSLYEAQVSFGGKTLSCRTAMPMAGDAAAENLACLALVCALLHVDLAEIEKRLQDVVLPGHRFSRKNCGSAILIDDCYNANPLSMKRMLQAAAGEAAASGSPLVAVLGEMGELGSLAYEAHVRLGRELKALAPVCVFWKGGLGDAIREGLGSAIPLVFFESDEELCAQMRSQGIKPGEKYTVLCKGSRSNHLETACLAMESYFGAESD